MVQQLEVGIRRAKRGGIRRVRVNDRRRHPAAPCRSRYAARIRDGCGPSPDSRAAIQIEAQGHRRGQTSSSPRPFALHQDVLAVGGAGADVAERVVAVATQRQDAARPGDLLAQVSVDEFVAPFRSSCQWMASAHRRSVGG